MARPRTFEEDRAVEAAMLAFWDAGYENTSTQALCAATGLGRSSIYNTFASKHDLFKKALRHYMDGRNARLAGLMGSGLPAKDKVGAVLGWAVEPDPEEPAGCLVVNSLVELGPHDPEVAELLRLDNDKRVRMMRSAIEEGMARGEIDAEKDALALAHFVVATVSGMRVAARGGAGRETLASIARTALDAF
ncbi:TetR/AcrR family transcriptional regulator [Nonomuraea longispora]|uniref:TetR/AcrR family transcriptional regulator n=1 Tax=Nonomuraea longispora TaxID=1848320 RepID=A0A4R4N9N3_9ACTN|nr:TetR/AcrR family transcriptional regulator [Nonomuraea longispora]TDC03212.1 TetR/AcrR family transcriptional regulator [Nonomuraea longispora]